MSTNRIIPVLICQDIAAAHDFLVSAYGFDSGGIQKTPDGTVMHAEVRLGEAAIWLHRVTAEDELASPRAKDVANSGLVVFVADVDAHYDHARDHGAKIDSSPTDQPYGQREYGTRDPEGHRWWFATPKAQAG